MVRHVAGGGLTALTPGASQLDNERLSGACDDVEHLVETVRTSVVRIRYVFARPVGIEVPEESDLVSVVRWSEPAKDGEVVTVHREDVIEAGEVI